MDKRPVDNKSIDEKFIQAAQRLVEDYHITLEGDTLSGFIGTCTEIPTFMGVGSTKEKCINETKKTIKVGIAYMLESNQEIPKPNC